MKIIINGREFRQGQKVKARKTTNGIWTKGNLYYSKTDEMIYILHSSTQGPMQDGRMPIETKSRRGTRYIALNPIQEIEFIHGYAMGYAQNTYHSEITGEICVEMGNVGIEVSSAEYSEADQYITEERIVNSESRIKTM